MNQSLTVSLSLAGAGGFRKIDAGALTLSGDNSGLSGQVLLSRGDVTVQSNTVLGTGMVVIDPGTSVNTRLILTANITLANPITMNTSNSGGGANGSILTNGAFDATLTGPITISGVATSGGHWAGSTGTNYLNITGAVTDKLPANFVAGALATALSSAVGTLGCREADSAFRIDNRAGILADGANNGIPTNAVLNLGGNGNGTFDLAGFNQTLAAVSNLIGANTNSVTNSSTTNASTLTLAPLPSNFSIPQYTNISFSGTIGDSGPSAPVNIVLNGDATGSQIFANTANTYSGSTTLSSGTLSVAGLADGGLPSSIGQSSNAATNLVFSGGVLQYTGTDVSTDRGFSLNSGKAGTVNVSTATATLTMAGSGTGAGGFIKAGPGTLLLSGNHTYTGNTTVAAGTLVLNGSTAAGSAVSISSGATLAGTGTANGVVTPASGGIIAPGQLGIGTLKVGGLTLNNGAIANFEFGGGNDQITVNNAGGLVLNGGNLNLFSAGGTTSFSTDGTYTLFNISGAISGAFELDGQQSDRRKVLHPGKYRDGGPINHRRCHDPRMEQQRRHWSVDDRDELDRRDRTEYRWRKRQFGAAAAGGIVNLNGNKTVSGLVFDNGASYTLSGTGSTLNLNNGIAAAAITVNSGSHTIAVPVLLGSASFISFAGGGGALTISRRN